jgi:hypothetical protein
VLEVEPEDLELLDVELAAVELVDAELAGVELVDAEPAGVELVEVELANVELVDVELVDVELKKVELLDVRVVVTVFEEAAPVVLHVDPGCVRVVGVVPSVFVEVVTAPPAPPLPSAPVIPKIWLQPTTSPARHEITTARATERCWGLHLPSMSGGSLDGLRSRPSPRPAQFPSARTCMSSWSLARGSFSRWRRRSARRP